MKKKLKNSNSKSKTHEEIKVDLEKVLFRLKNLPSSKKEKSITPESSEKESDNEEILNSFIDENRFIESLPRINSDETLPLIRKTKEAIPIRTIENISTENLPLNEEFREEPREIRSMRGIYNPDSRITYNPDSSDNIANQDKGVYDITTASVDSVLPIHMPTRTPDMQSFSSLNQRRGVGVPEMAYPEDLPFNQPTREENRSLPFENQGKYRPVKHKQL